MRKILIIGMVAIALGLSSCNVTRTITTRSEAWQNGDTSVVIQTKTVETYDASKNGCSVCQSEGRSVFCQRAKRTVCTLEKTSSGRFFLAYIKKK